MNEEGKFVYNVNGVTEYCAITYFEKDFYLTIFENEQYTTWKKNIRLFPVRKYTENQRLIAFHVANLHVLPNLIGS